MGTTMADLPHDEQAGHSGFARELPENSVEYLLFVIDNKYDARATSLELEAIRKAALELSHDLTKDYIWQRHGFNLELKTEGGLLYLHGVTEYGDAVEDEWLIVYMLRQLTQSHPNLWVRVFDTDGEFLLVEAANVLPKWLSPENDHNRVWIHTGKLFIIPSQEEANPALRNISLPVAVEFIKTSQDSLVHSSFIQAEAFYRLEKYPGQVADSIHYSLVTIPRKVAFILHSLPTSVAPAVEAFYLRDAIALKPVLTPSAPLVFPPEDFVTVSVRFSRVLFAQLRSQRFETPSRWQKIIPKSCSDPSETDEGNESTRRLELGMKLTCGFEMLAANAETSKSRVVRELAIVLEDLKEDGDESLPSDAEIRAWTNADRNDSEAWLDINYVDFERELDGKHTGARGTGGRRFGDTQAQENLRKIVSRFESFLNDEQAGLEGAELDDMDYDDDDDDDDDYSDMEEDSDVEDKEVSFDEKEFSRMMREMMGLPPTTGSTTNPSTTEGKTKDEKQKSSPTIQEDEDEEIRELSSRMEAELNAHGALKLDAPSTKQPKSKDEEKGTGKEKDAVNYDEDADKESDEQVDVDYNLAKNILESFKSQGGMSGPTGNLLGMMGLNLPRDEDDGEDEVYNREDGPSRQAK